MKRSTISTLLASAAGSLILALPHAAAAEDADVKFYGQLNLGFFDFDDGVDNDTFFSDNNNSNSRVGAIYESHLSNGGTLKFHFETALGLFGTNAATVDDNDLDFNESLSELRKFEVVYKSPEVGTFSFGQGSTATDGVGEADLSGTSVVAYSDLSDIGGSIEFRDNDGAFTGTNVGSVFQSNDGARRFRLRYDTPEINGFVLSTSIGEEVLTSGNNNEFYDFSLTYAKDYGYLELDARVGYAFVDGGDEQAVGSVSILHETGFNATLAAGSDQESNEDYAYFKLGYKQDWFAFGATALSIDVYEGNDFEIEGSDSSSVGVAVVQNIDALDLEVYASYRTFDFDATGTDFEDVDVAGLGARWKF